MREWQTVTVAFSASSSEATGLPTRSLRPTTTACAPSSGVSYARSSSITPDGVAGTRPSRPWTSRPAFVGREPVDVLRRVDRGRGTRRVEVAGQRQLDDDAAHRRVGVQLARRPRAAPPGRCRSGSSRPIERDADLGARPVLAGHVDLRGRVVADQHGRQPGRRAAFGDELRHVLGDLLPGSAAATALPSMIVAIGQAS